MNFYLHIPFCRQKCPYCKFALTPVFDEVKKKRYLGYLKREIQKYFSLSSGTCEGAIQALHRADSSYCQNDKEIKTIYFGGGTPSILSIQEVQDLLELFPRDKNTEISFECNPEDITSKYVEGICQLGINRLSIGVQSLCDATLRAIHRSDRGSIFRALEAVQNALLSFSERESLSEGTSYRKKYSFGLGQNQAQGTFGILNFEFGISINVDFILGLPYAKPGETLSAIKQLHAEFPFITHTSVYMLEEGEYPKEWKNHSISEQEMEEEYGQICRYFDSLGWHHYEISNWARPGYECSHNQGYWSHAEYRGFGLSATSYRDGLRWENNHSFAGYYRGERLSEEIITEADKRLEEIIHRLRTFSLDIDGFSSIKLEELIGGGYIEIQEGKIILTPTGIFRENFILSELL